jgi:hypothetical protein
MDFMKLVKDILKAATYRPDASNPAFAVDVTTDVLDHWSRTFNDMKSAEIGIPVPWEHPPRGDANSDPLEWAARKQGDPRSNAGWVDSVYREGDTLFAVLDIDDRYADDLQKSGCYVSPKFGGTWTDSLSRTWENPIHHIALTTKPVAVNQSRNFTPFATPALAFSREMCFSTSQWSQPEENDVTLTPEEAIDRILENPDVLARAAEKLGVHEFSATPGMGMPPGMPQGDPGMGQPEPEPEPEQSPDAVATCMQILHSVSQALHEGMQAMAALHGVNTGGDNDEDDLPPPPPAPAPQATATPAVVSMSRDELIGNPLYAALEHRQTKMEREAIANRVEALFDSGRATRVKCDELIAGVGKYEFSRQTEMQNVLLLERIKTLEETQPGSAIPSDGAQQFSRKAQVVSHNTAFNSDEEMTDERANEILAAEFGIKK